MSGIVSSVDYAFGYIDQAQALLSGLVFASIINLAGNTIAASEASLVSAMEDKLGTLTNFSRFTTTLADGPGNDSYPLTAFSYLIVHKTLLGDCATNTEMLRFFYWCFHDPTASTIAMDNYFVRVSDPIVALITEILDELICGGVQLNPTSIQFFSL